MASTSHYTYSPIPLPSSANPKYFTELGRRVDGFDASTVSQEQMVEIIDMLYKVIVHPRSFLRIQNKLMFRSIRYCCSKD